MSEVKEVTLEELKEMFENLEDGVVINIDLGEYKYENEDK